MGGEKSFIGEEIFIGGMENSEVKTQERERRDKIKTRFILRSGRP